MQLALAIRGIARAVEHYPLIPGPQRLTLRSQHRSLNCFVQSKGRTRLYWVLIGPGNRSASAP